MKRFLIILPFLFISSGCAKAAHLPQLLTLKSYSDNKNQQKVSVKHQDKKFEALLKTVEAGSMNEYYVDKEQVMRAFGEPIFVKAVTLDSKPMEEWMYRYAAEYLNSKKVYLYFDGNNLLQRWEIVNPGEIPQIVSTGG